MSTTYVCDWTEWQGGICPAETIQREGFGMVKLKAGGSANRGWAFTNPFFPDSASAVLATRMIPGAFWYLSPEKPHAQAGLFADLLFEVSAGPSMWGCFLDVEQPGVEWGHVEAFANAWSGIVSLTPLAVYTRRSFWTKSVDPTNAYDAANRFPFLEESHWVSGAVRTNPETRYASQQYKAVDPEWWNVRYSGWPWADMLQFTDKALVAGQKTSASVYRGTPQQLRRHLRISP